MPIKTASGPRCLKHQIECTFNCGWCGKPICEDCVASAGGKKYCDKCWQKKKQSAPQQLEPTARPTSGPRIPIKNIDNSLDQKSIEAQRIANQQKILEEKKKKVFDL